MQSTNRAILTLRYVHTICTYTVMCHLTKTFDYVNVNMLKEMECHSIQGKKLQLFPSHHASVNNTELRLFPVNGITQDSVFGVCVIPIIY